METREFILPISYSTCILVPLLVSETGETPQFLPSQGPAEQGYSCVSWARGWEVIRLYIQPRLFLHRHLENSVSPVAAIQCSVCHHKRKNFIVNLQHTYYISHFPSQAN